MNNRLYVGNLDFHTTENTLQAEFARCGDVEQVKLILDRETGRSRGFAFVTMADEASAQKAIAEMNGFTLDGRTLRVNEAEDRQRGGGGGGGGGRDGGGGGGGRDGGGGRGGQRRW